jgi:hypothetical protein
MAQSIASSSRGHGLAQGAAEPAGPFPAGFVGQLRTDDIDEMRAAAPGGWEEEWRQFGCGRFRGRISMGCTSQLLLARASFEPGLYSCGPRAADTITLYVSFQNRGPACLRGRPMRPDEVAILFPDEATDFRTAAPFDVFVLAIQRARFERHAAAVLGCPLAYLRKHERLGLVDLTAFRRRADATLSAIVQAPAPAASWQFRDSRGCSGGVTLRRLREKGTNGGYGGAPGAWSVSPHTSLNSTGVVVERRSVP